MAIQSAQTAAARIESWFATHPQVGKTDKNIALLTQYIASKFSVAGETIIDNLYLDLAYQSIGGSMDHIASPELQAQIAETQRQAQALLQEKQAREAEAERERKRIEAETLREARQNNRRPGAASAYEGREDTTAQRQREATERQNSIIRARQHEQFVAELSAANQILITIPGGGMVKWGATNDARASARAELRRRYPQFSNEIK